MIKRHYTPDCSIITVNLNNAEGLRRTLISVDSQKHDSVESIVIDGGSHDASVQILHSRVSNMRTVHLSEDDGGIYVAMNKGLRLASGSLVVFMNSGDVFSDDEVVGRIISDWHYRQWTWLYGCGRIVDQNGEALAVLQHVPFSYSKLALGRSTIPHQAVYMERSLLSQLGGFNTTIGIAADQELLVRASKLSIPATRADFLVDFEGAGIGSSRPAWELPVQLRQARKDAGTPVAGGWSTDWVATAVVAASRTLGPLKSRWARRLLR